MRNKLGNRKLKLNKETLRQLSGELQYVVGGIILTCTKGNKASCQGGTISGTDTCSKGEISCNCA